MVYRLRIARRAHRALRRLPPGVVRGLRDAINGLRDHPHHPRGCKELRGGAGWRVRVGDTRVIYDVDDDA